MPQVVISIKGGVAHPIEIPEGVEVVVRDEDERAACAYWKDRGSLDCNLVDYEE